MSWIITGTQKLDPDAAVYIDRVEAADGQSLEEGVKLAYSTFVSGCKTDGIWDAIKASCILAGARTLNGALVPLVGTAPTNYNFVSGDYNRETGLVGDGSTKYLDSNRTVSLDPLNNRHISTFLTSVNTLVSSYAGAAGTVSNSRYHIETGPSNSFLTRNANNTFATNASILNAANKLLGMSRASASSYQVRVEGSTFSNSINSILDGASTVLVFCKPVESSYAPIGVSDARLSFYSIGESLDLALLDTRVTTLMSDLAAAIP